MNLRGGDLNPLVSSCTRSTASLKKEESKANFKLEFKIEHYVKLKGAKSLEHFGLIKGA